MDTDRHVPPIRPGAAAGSPAAAGARADGDRFACAREALADVVAVPVTPFAADGSPDTVTYRALLRRLLDHGVRTLTTGGNTGEFHALTPEERRAQVESAVAEAGDTAQVIAGVGLDLPTAVSAARHARDAGAAMVMVHQPPHPYAAQGGWTAYHRAVAEAVPELGVVPYIRDAALDGSALAALGEECPNVVGVKYAVPDAARFAAVACDAGAQRFVWVAGLAELYAPAYFACGATGFTSGLVNVAPRLPLAMLSALRAGDFAAAMRVWERARPFEALRARERSAHNVTVVKEALSALGLCRPDVRPPSLPLPTAERAEVAAAARALIEDAPAVAR